MSINATSATDCPQRLAYSVKEAAEVSSLGRTTIYSLISSGKLRPVKVGQRTVISRSDLESVLLNREALPQGVTGAILPAE